MMFKVTVVEDASCVYIIEAGSPEAAKLKLLDGELTDVELQSFRDLGHDNVEIIEIEEVRPTGDGVTDRERKYHQTGS